METQSIFDNNTDRTFFLSFWNRDYIDLVQRANKHKILLDDIMLRRSQRSGELIPKKYVIFDDILIKQKFKYQIGDDLSQCYSKFVDLFTLHVEEQKMIYANEIYLGFRLIYNNKPEEIYTKNKNQYTLWQQILRSNCFFGDFQQQYRSLKLIGEGGFAKVYKAQKNSDMQEYAVKCIQKQTLKQSDDIKNIILNEITLLKSLDHPYIVKLYEVYESGSYLYLVQELMRGGHILEKISKKGFYTEQDASKLMTKLFEALAYLHGKDIIHRDIKIDNLILIDNQNDYDIKIIDFGLACKIDSEFVTKRCGTPGFTAPEILNKKSQCTKVDMFSAGVVMYILIIGQLPFHASTRSQLIKQNAVAQIKFNFPESNKPSINGILLHMHLFPLDLMQKLLERDPKKRISAIEALQHPWIQTKAVEAPQREQRILKSAQENINKFLKEDRFNVSKIKPFGGFQAQAKPILTSQSKIDQGNKEILQIPNLASMNDEQIEADEQFDKFEIDAGISEEESGLYNMINKLNREIYIRKPSKDTFSSAFNSQSNSANSSRLESPNINNLNYINSPKCLQRKVEALKSASGLMSMNILPQPPLNLIKKPQNKLKMINSKLKNFDGI